MVQTEFFPSAQHFREKVWEERLLVCESLIIGSTPKKAAAKANCTVWIWHYTLWVSTSCKQWMLQFLHALWFLNDRVQCNEDIKLPNNFIFLRFVKKLAKICSCQNQFSPIWVFAVKLLFIKYSPILKLRKKLPWKSPTYLQSCKTVVNCFSSNMYISFFLIKQ